MGNIRALPLNPTEGYYSQYGEGYVGNDLFLFGGARGETVSASWKLSREETRRGGRNGSESDADRWTRTPRYRVSLCGARGNDACSACGTHAEDAVEEEERLPRGCVSFRSHQSGKLMRYTIRVRRAPLHVGEFTCNVVRMGYVASFGMPSI